MTPLLNQIYETETVSNRSGEVVPLGGRMDRDQCLHLFDLIKGDTSITQTLEVGLAHGLSAMHICEALRGRSGAHHTAVDPFQKDQFQSIGLFNLEKSGIDFFDLIEKRSEFALPELTESRPASYDLIFIDGWHSFDHTLVDAFYSLRLLRVGGYLALDDCNWDSVDGVVRYLAHYPSLEIHSIWDRSDWRHRLKRILNLPFIRFFLPPKLKRRVNKLGRMVIFKKIAEDTRSVYWYEPF